MNKQDYEELLTLAISTGADFAEIYLEDGISKNFQVVNSKLDNISTRTSKGIGIRLIKDNDLLSKWSYVAYRRETRDIILCSDSRYIAENSSEVLAASRTLSAYMDEFEKSNTQFRILPTTDIAGNESLAIAYYIPELKLVGLYYKDINSIVKDSDIDKGIFQYIFLHIAVFVILFLIYLSILKFLLSSIKKANISAESLIGKNGDLRKKTVNGHAMTYRRNLNWQKWR